MDNILFSRRLKALRKKQGYTTPDEFADAYERKYGDGTSSFLPSLKNYERSRCVSNPSAQVVSNLCDLLHCDADYLLGRSDVVSNVDALIHQHTGLNELAIARLRAEQSADSIHNNNIRSLGTTIADFINFVVLYEELADSADNDDGKKITLMETFTALAIAATAKARQDNTAAQDAFLKGSGAVLNARLYDMGLGIESQGKLAEVYIARATELFGEALRSFVSFKLKKKPAPDADTSGAEELEQ